jgi:hypothetical protein
MSVNVYAPPSAPILYMEDDFFVSASGTFRLATPAEAVRQDVGHMVDELGLLGEPGTTDTASALRAAILDLLMTHPVVQSIDAVTVTPTPGGANTFSISIRVNGNPAAIILATPSH